MPRVPERLEVLQGREFRLWISAEAVSILGDRAVAIALAFAVLELGGSAPEVGLVLASRALATVLFLLVGGVVADRMSRRAVMVSADLARFVSQGVLAVLLIAGAIDIWVIAALAAVTGAATGFFSPASTGLLPAVVAAEHLQHANGIRATVASAGQIVGPAAAGIIIAITSAGWALAIDAATFALSALLLSRLRLPRRLPGEPSGFVTDLRDGWTVFRSYRWVWTIVLAAALGNMVWGAWTTLGPVVAERQLGGAAVWGSILAAMGAGALLGSVLAIRGTGPSPLRVVVLSWCLFAVPLALLASGAPVLLLAIGALVAGGGMMLGNSIWETTLQRNVPAASLSRVSAYDWFGSLAFYPLGVALFGPLAAVIGLNTTLWVAAFVLLAVWLAALAIPDVRKLPGSPATSAGTRVEHAPPQGR